MPLEKEHVIAPVLPLHGDLAGPLLGGDDLKAVLDTTGGDGNPVKVYYSRGMAGWWVWTFSPSEHGAQESVLCDLAALIYAAEKTAKQPERLRKKKSK